MFVWTDLFVLRFNVLATIFQSSQDGATAAWDIKQCAGKLMCLAQGHNTVPRVGIKPKTSGFEATALPLFGLRI